MTDPIKSEPIQPVSVTVIGTESDGLPPCTTATTPGLMPNIVVTVITPLVAIVVRFLNAYFTTLAGLITAGMATNVIPAEDFYHLVLKCATLSLAGAALGALKDIVTVFGKLEGKFPLATGSV